MLNKFVMGIALLLVLTLLSNPAVAQAPADQARPVNVPELLVKADKAYAAGDYATLAVALERLVQARPYNSEYMYRLVLAYALLDDPSSAYNLMLRMQQQGLAYDFTLTDDSMNIRGTEVFGYVNDLMKQAAQPMGEATPIFTLPGDVITPANLAWDPTREKYLVGTVAEGQVLAVDGQGGVEELIKADNANGMWAVLDILVDVPRNRLWVSSAAIPGFDEFSPVDKGRSALYEYELDSLKFIRWYPVPVDGRSHALGSMVMNPAGDIFIADRALPIVYVKRAAEEKLTGVFATREMVSLRGIAMQPDGRVMYLADREMGIMVIDLEAQRAGKLVIPDNLNLGGIDGMYLWNNNLVIIQNGIKPQRVMRLGLDATGTRVENVRPLAVAQPVFDFPNFGAVKGEDLVYFAGSRGWDSKDEARAITVVRTALDANEDLLPPEILMHLEQQKQAAAQKKEAEKEE